MAEKDYFKILDSISDELIAMRSMFNVAVYLMGGEERRLEWPYDDFEIWLCDLRDRISRILEMI